MRESKIIGQAIEETEIWYAENHRRQVAVREIALYAIDKYLELQEDNPKE